MRSVGLSLRTAYLATASHRMHGARRRGLGVALAVLCGLCLAAPRAEAYPLVDHFLPVLRVDLGAAWRVQPESTQPAFTLNVNAGIAKTPLKNPLIVLGELGYSYTHGHTHAFTAGVGIGAGLPFIASIYVTPRLVVGSDDGRNALGMRTGIGGAFFMDILTFEVAHQFLSAGAGLEHEARLTLGLNIGTIVTLAALGVGL